MNFQLCLDKLKYFSARLVVRPRPSVLMVHAGICARFAPSQHFHTYLSTFHKKKKKKKKNTETD
jgi:hypothetical protein